MAMMFYNFNIIICLNKLICQSKNKFKNYIIVKTCTVKSEKYFSSRISLKLIIKFTAYFLHFCFEILMIMFGRRQLMKTEFLKFSACGRPYQTCGRWDNHKACHGNIML